MDRVNDNARVGPVNDCGFVTRVRGSVIDVEFATGRLPPINDALAIELSHDLRLIAEVQEHLNRHNIRALVFSQIAGVEVIYAQHGEGPFAHLERHRFLPRGTPAAEQHREKAPLLINVRSQLVFDDIVEEYFSPRWRTPRGNRSSVRTRHAFEPWRRPIGISKTTRTNSPNSCSVFGRRR